MARNFEIVTTTPTGYTIWATIPAQTRAEAERLAQSMARDEEEENGY